MTGGERFNDGKVDPMGRYWAGTLARDSSNEIVGKAASLYLRDVDGTMKMVLKELSISNGLVWSKDPWRCNIFWIVGWTWIIMDRMLVRMKLNGFDRCWVSFDMT